MDNFVKSLFDYHKFDKNSRLSAMIAQVEGKYGVSLDDADLEFVNAAGSFNNEDVLRRPSKNKDGKKN